MLKKLNISYLFLGGGGMLLFLPWIDPNYLTLFLLNLTGFVFYFLTVNIASGFKSHSTSCLTIIVILYSLFFVTLYNVVSFLYQGNFFVFSEADAVAYHTYSQEMANMSVVESIRYFLGYYGIDDVGMVFILSTIYRLIESNLFYNLFNVGFGVATAVIIFRVGRYIMSQKYAFLCAMTFSLSSFYLWFHASGLKESFMVLLIVFFFHQYFSYIYKKRVRSLIFASLTTLSFIFFRPVIILFLLVSVGLGIFFDKVSGYKKILFIIMVFILTGISYSFIEQSLFQYVKGGDIELLLAARASEGMIVGTLPFTYSVNILAQLIGPLPTIISDLSYLSLFSPGLIYRMLLAFPFWVGCFFAFKMKKRNLYPIIIFIVMEMASLALILEGLELRKSMPHIPLIYIIAFWFMDYYKAGFFKKNKIIQGMLVVYPIFVGAILIFWNFR